MKELRDLKDQTQMGRAEQLVMQKPRKQEVTEAGSEGKRLEG